MRGKAWYEKIKHPDIKCHNPNKAKKCLGWSWQEGELCRECYLRRDFIKSKRFNKRKEFMKEKMNLIKSTRLNDLKTKL